MNQSPMESVPPPCPIEPLDVMAVPETADHPGKVRVLYRCTESGLLYNIEFPSGAMVAELAVSLRFMGRIAWPLTYEIDHALKEIEADDKNTTESQDTT